MKLLKGYSYRLATDVYMYKDRSKRMLRHPVCHVVGYDTYSADVSYMDDCDPIKGRL